MIGSTYWATGIVVTYHEGGVGGPMAKPEPRLWSAKVEFLDNGFCQVQSTEGEVRTRYALPTISEAIDTLKADVDRLGIEWKAMPGFTPTIYYRGDGEHPDYPPPPGWRDLVNGEAARLGWEPSYTADEDES